MKQFVPRDKMSKRSKKGLDTQKRTVWNIKPTTKIVKSKKVYDRKQQPRNYEPYDSEAVFYGSKTASAKSMSTAHYLFPLKHPTGRSLLIYFNVVLYSISSILPLIHSL